MMSGIISEMDDGKINRAMMRQKILAETESLKGNELAARCRALNVSVSSVLRWRRRAAASDNGGALAALARKARSDRGHQRAIDGSIAQIIRASYLKKSRPSVSDVHREVNEVLTMQGLRPVSYATIRRVCEAVPRQMLLYGRETAKTIRDNEFHVRRARPKKPREWVDADHHKLDLFVLDRRGRPARPWLTAIHDLSTSEILGFHVSFQANSATIALAMRHAILKKPDPAYPSCGLFQHFLTDWGKDFLSRDIRAFTNDMNIAREKAAPYHGQEKPIERFFRTLEEQCVRKLPGWCGNKPDKRPDDYRPELDLDCLRQMIYGFIVNEYHHRESAALAAKAGSPARSPMGALLEAVSDGFSPRIPREDTLDILLMRARNRKVQRDGVHLLGRDGSYWDDCLGLHIGESVNIRFDPDHLGFINVYAASGSYICRALHRPRLEMDASVSDLKEAGRIKRKQRETARQYVEDQKKALIGFTPLAEVAHAKAIESNRGRAEKIAVAQGVVLDISAEFGTRPARDVSRGTRIYTSDAERRFFSSTDRRTAGDDEGDKSDY